MKYRQISPEPPEAYRDCNLWSEFRGGCIGLKEPLCITRGACKFYRSRLEKCKAKEISQRSC